MCIFWLIQQKNKGKDGPNQTSRALQAPVCEAPNRIRLQKTLGPLDTIFSVRREIRKLGTGFQSTPSDLSTQRTRRNPFALEMGRPILPQLPSQFWEPSRRFPKPFFFVLLSDFLFLFLLSLFFFFFFWLFFFFPPFSFSRLFIFIKLSSCSKIVVKFQNMFLLKKAFQISKKMVVLKNFS